MQSPQSSRTPNQRPPSRIQAVPVVSEAEKARRVEEARQREETKKREEEIIAEEKRREEEKKERERKEEERKSKEKKRKEEEKKKLEEQKKKLEEKKKKEEEKRIMEEKQRQEEEKNKKKENVNNLTNKMDKLIKKMEGILSRKNIDEDYYEGDISADEIENLVRQIVLQTLDIPGESPKEENRNNPNALDSILENLLLDSYTDSIDLTEKPKKSEKLIIKAPESRKSEAKTTNKGKSSQKSVKKPEEQVTINDDVIDGIVDKLFPLIEQVQSRKKTDPKEPIKSEKVEDHEENVVAVIEEKESFDAVQKALTILIGDNPSEDEKLSPEVFAAVLELDKYLRVEEKERTKKKTEVEDLLNSALDYVDTAVTKREEAEERLVKLRGKEENTKQSALAKILSGLRVTPSELEKLL